eukprot:SAG11_NODE_431_length_9526_cov_11.297019_7_plen_89_part_00
MVPIYQVLDHPTDIRGRPPACIPMLLCTQISVHTDLRYATAAGLEYDEGVRVHRGDRKGMGIEDFLLVPCNRVGKDTPLIEVEWYLVT